MKQNNHNNIEEIISRLSVRELSSDEQDLLWNRIQRRTTPAYKLFIFKHPMIASILIALALLGGTVVTADAAHPGDALYGVDRAVENMRLKLASDPKKNDLRIRFAEERLNEIQDITKKASTVTLTESMVTKIEADIFTNETIIKIEWSGGKTTFASTAKTKDEVVAAITARYTTLSKAFVESKLDLQLEDRPSHDDDKVVVGNTADLSAEERAKVTLGIESALNLINGVKGSDARIEGIATQLNGYLTTLPADARIQLTNNKLQIKFDGGPERIEVKEQGKSGKAKIDVRTNEGRIRVEVKDGVVEVKEQQKGKEEQDNKSDAKSDDKVSAELEAEAKITNGQTVVKVEVNDDKTTFTTSATTKEAIAAEIEAKFPSLTSAQISSVLKIEDRSR